MFVVMDRGVKSNDPRGHTGLLSLMNDQSYLLGIYIFYFKTNC